MKTAVELLEKELLEYLYYCVIESVEKDNRFIRIDVLRVKPMFDRAKQMDREQSKQDYSVGYSNGQVNSNRTAEQYYNETYGKDE